MGKLFISFFNRVMGWFVHVSGVHYTNQTIERQIIVVIGKEIERADDAALKASIKAAAELAGVEVFLNKIVKEEVES